MVIYIKIIIQKLWQLKVNWDATLPPSIESEWQNYHKKLTYLNSLVIKRSIIGNGNIHEVQLHGFADISLTSYSAYLYLCIKNSVGEVTTNLICSKLLALPLKTVSLLQLELLAVMLLTRLVSKYSSNLNSPIEKKYYWSDLTVVLLWVSSQSSRWKTFVAYRVSDTCAHFYIAMASRR